MLDIVIGLWWLWLIILIITAVIITFVLYTLVPANVSDVVIQRGQMRVFSSHIQYGTEVLEKDEAGNPLSTKASYFKMPSWLPIYGMVVHRMPLKIITMNVPDFLAFDKNRARFETDIRAYVAIEDVVKAAKRFPSGLEELKEQTINIVRATVRDVTTKKTIREIINDREGVMTQVREPLAESLNIYGLGLQNIELIEFKDPTKDIPGVKERPHVIADISSIEEVKINSEARQKNAEEVKEARLKEAVAEETAKKRELQRDEMIARRDELKKQEVAKQEKITMEETLEVKKVEEVKTEQIAKAQQEVEAEKERLVAKIDATRRQEVEKINKEQKRLEGEGDKIRDVEQAIGVAAPIREKGNAEAEVIEKKLLAEAKGKDELQKALNRFGSAALMALVAEKLVDMQKDVGIAGARALEAADLRIFAGGGDKDGFDLGKMIEQTRVSSESTGAAIINRIARPNDLGLKDFGALIPVIQEINREAEYTDAKEKKLEEIKTRKTKTKSKTKTDARKEVAKKEERKRRELP